MSSTNDKHCIKNNHKILTKSDLSSFVVTAYPMHSNRNSSTSLDTMSVQSTISSTSGPITAWEQAWVLSNSSRLCSYSRGSANSRTSHESTTDDKSISTSSSQSNAASKVHAINDICFLRHGGSLLVAEPLKRRVKVFSNKHHTLLTTIDHRNNNFSSCLSPSFTPTCLSETNHEGVVAVTSNNEVYYIRVDGPQHSDLEANIELKDRINLSALECLSGEALMVAEKDSHFLATYNLSGKLLREYKKPVYPLGISWSPDHQIAAVVDRENHSVLLLDKDCKLLNFVNVKKTEKTPIFHPQKLPVFDIFSQYSSSPTSVAWCRSQHLIVAVNNGLITFDFRNLSKELSLTENINNAHVIATNIRGNRLAVAQTYDQLVQKTCGENKINEKIEGLCKILNDLNVTRTSMLKINDLKKGEIKKEITELENFKTKNERMSEISTKTRKIYTLQMFERHGVSRQDGGVSLMTD